jgi:hypothetical protein
MIADSLDVYKVPEILVARIALETGVDALLISAIIIKESGGNKYAQQYQPDYPYVYRVSEFARSIGCSYSTELHMQRTSWGLMQIMGATARYLGFSGWFGQLIDPETNIRFGARQLSKLLKTYGLESDVISAYNQGQPFRAQDGRYKNQEYVNDILKLKARLK